MSTDKSVSGLVTPEENLITQLAGYVLGGRSMQMTTLVGVLQLLERQTAEIISLNQQLSAKTISEQNIINAFGIKGEGAPSKLVIEYVHGMVAESAGVNDRLQKLIQIVNNADNSYCMCGDSMKNHAGGGCGSPTGMFDYHYNAWLESEKEMPNTDSAIAEIKAQGVDGFAVHKREIAAGYKRNGCEESWAEDAEDCALGADLFAANLRAGRK